MAISKVVYGAKVLVDLTSDTVDAAHLADGYTAHDASGNLIVGTLAEWEPMKGTIEFDQQTAGVSAYFQSTKDYTASNHETVSHANMLPSGGDTCSGYELDVPTDTTSVYVAREDGSEGVAHYTPEGGKVTVYNLAPDTIYAYWCISEDGTLKKGGFMRADAGVRLLRMSKLRNCRDIGGWACDGGKVRYGMLFRCADTADASEEDADELKRLGVGSEYDLRSAQEVQAAGADSKLHAAYSILGFGSWTDTAFSDLTNLHALKAIMESAVRGEVPIVHCQYGSDRTGRIMYILEALLGVSLEDADRDYELSSMYVARDRTAEMSKDARFEPFRRALIPSEGETVADKAASLIRDKRIVTYDLINAFRAAMSTGKPRALVWTHSLAQTLSGCISSVSATSVNDGEPFTCVLTADEGRRLDSVTVSMGGTDITSSAYANGTIKIASVTGDVTITATTAEISTSHSITVALSHVTISNSAASVDKNGPYSATVTPDTGYAAPTITVTMGGADITSSAVSGSAISIASVTGDVIITATAARLSNLIPISTDASGNAFGTNGIKSGARIGSGGESAAPATRLIYTDGTRDLISCTGFIPVETDKRIHFKSCNLLYNTDGKEVWPVYVMFYDADHKRIASAGTEADYFVKREELKPTTAEWSGKAIASIDGTTYTGGFRVLTSMLINPANANVGSAARYVRISAYGLTSDARVWLTDE